MKLKRILKHHTEHLRRVYYYMKLTLKYISQVNSYIQFPSTVRQIDVYDDSDTVLLVTFFYDIVVTFFS